jgi:hypothetical protein
LEQIMVGFSIPSWGRVLVLAWCAWLLASCSSGSPPTGIKPGEKGLGERCAKTEDCASLLCVSLDDQSGICSTFCQMDGDCPASDNWACLSAVGQQLDVCACRPLAMHEICGDGLDNNCDGKIDDCRICDGKAVENDDHEHCGACDNPCRVDQSCEAGKCQCLAEHPDVCKDGCVDLMLDPQHCGDCDTACGEGQVCRAGQCGCPRSTDTYCPGVGCVDASTSHDHCGACGTTCASVETCNDGKCQCPNAANSYCGVDGCLDLATSHDHCGSCDNACDLGRACDKGKCVCPAQSASDFCPGVGCVDFDSSQDHCGACAKACRADQICSGAKCACSPGMTECGGKCVDTNADGANCGGCGTKCPASQACIDGNCGCSSRGYTACGDICALVGNDPQNCAKCGDTCGVGESCSGGLCGCDSGVYCGSTCMPDHDQQNCGACGKACPVTQFCGAGTCECAGAGLSPCGDACVDLAYDEANCGACGKTCRSGESCNKGQCACPAGQTYCDSAGKCVPLGSDTNNCGACGKACNPTEACDFGTCECPTYGQLYCAAEGACTDTLSNVTHCGGCDTTCRPTEVCSSGSCQCPSQSQTYCANSKACVYTQTDSKNCGACGKACPAGTHCDSSGCVCNTAGQTLCGSKCYDLTTNVNNCGSCGKACTSPLICAHSTCTCQSSTVGAAVQVTNSAQTSHLPAAAWDGTHLGVVYSRWTTNLRSNYGNLRFALLDPDGTVVSDTALSDYPPDDYEGVWDYSQPAVVYNGSEYGVAWVHHLSELTSMAAEIRFARVSTAGVASPSVVVATSTELTQSPTGPGLAWASGLNTYAIAYARTDDQKVRFRTIGADGTTLATPKLFDGLAYNPALASDGSRWCIGWHDNGYTSAQQVIDPSVKTPSPTLFATDFDTGSQTNVHWDGSSFLSLGTGRFDRLRWLLSGGEASEFLSLSAGAGPTQLLGVEVGGTEALVWHEASGKMKFQRFSVPVSAAQPVSPIDDAITIPVFGEPYRSYALVQVGTQKLMLLYSALAADKIHYELFANVIDVPACP